MTIRKIFFAALSFVLLFSFVPLHADETNETNSATETNSTKSAVMRDLEDLVTRINNKIRNREATTNLQGNIQEFDQLLAKYKNAGEEERAQILLMKGHFYVDVLNEPEGALEVIRQFQRDFPKRQIQGDTGKVIESLERAVATKKVRDQLAPGKAFPDFSVTDIDGKPLSLASYKGKVVLIDFWATWCMPCIMSLPEVIQAYKTYHPKGFEVIGISLDENLQTLKRFIRDREMTWPQYNDGKRWDNKLAVQYTVQAIPTTFLIDKEGRIIGANLQGDDLENAIRKALEKSASEFKPAPTKTPKS